MPFYSLALNYNSSWKSENAGPHRIRFLVITPDRGTADLLFRVIQDNPRDLTERVSFDEIRRLSPQMWSWSATGHDDHTGLQQTIVDINRGNVRHKDNKSKEHLEKLRGKVTFQYVGDWTENFFVIPHLDVPDHISGQTFCIRSQRVPSQFWHYPHANARETKNVTLSTTERAIFKIQAEGARDKETLMVDTDKVQLELVVVDDTQSYPSSLHSEEIQGYNDAPVFNARRCPRFEYFDCKECVPLRNGDNGQPCACDGWVYDDFTKECRPSSITPPPSNCEADLQQCRNEMHRVEQELQNCRQNCGRNRRSPRRRNPVNLNMTVMVSSSPSLQNLYLTPKQETTDASLCPPMEEVIRDSHAKDH